MKNRAQSIRKLPKCNHTILLFMSITQMYSPVPEKELGDARKHFPFGVTVCAGRNKHGIRHRSNFALLKASNNLRSVITTFQISVFLICVTKGILPGDHYDIF